ncbi:MAG TPA: DNA-deoxyinosine glycosylase [Flavobacteriales bacterium]
MNQGIIHSFPPIVDENCRILILGTMPGEESLRQQQYYAHKRNLFWKILSEVLNEPFTLDYEERKQMLLRHRIALWDVCHNCVRKGSLDSDIKLEVPNKIDALIEKHPSIQTIAFNGKKAEALYKKHFDRLEHLLYLSLPSTSPANASISMNRKLAAWSRLASL